MICVVIKGPSFDAAYEQVSKAIAYADLVELRLDCFASFDLDNLKILRSHFSIPMIFTLRSQIQGGSYLLSEESRLDAICHLLTLNPEYLDLECQLPAWFYEKISLQYPEIKLILSYHNFENTPENLSEIYQEMQKTPAFFYKIAVMANSSLDALRLMGWAKKNDDRLIAISMGMEGQISRILAPLISSPITYACLEEDQTASCQLTAKTLIEQYHYHCLSPMTAIYGLIGDPVEKSISDETHNDLMRAFSLDAVYVKIQLSLHEMPQFLQLSKELPFQGLSVTMPLKESILPFLDQIDSQAKEIKAVNTLVFKDGKIIGLNTDGIGALNAIEREFHVKGKKIVIIGAGGAAKAIAYEASLRGGQVIILNRSKEKASQAIARMPGMAEGLDYIATCAQVGYDILINCTPVSLPIRSEYILPHSLVMDITTNPKETSFLKLARDKGCPIIYGYRMFIEQALGQFNLWFNPFNIQDARIVLEKKCLNRL